MYTQFFGNYLLEKSYVNQEQLFSAMKKLASERMRLGTLAIHAGYMSASEVDRVVIEQTHEDKKFGEIAIEFGYLSEDQVVELLKSQSPDFLLLGQILVDDGVLSNQDLENIIADYRSQNELIDLDMTVESHETVKRLIDIFIRESNTNVTTFGKMYIELLFNNFLRFIGEDFTPVSTENITEFPPECCVYQSVEGIYSAKSYISMDKATAIEFASRYVGDTFEEYDEYVQASLEDFLNLHNGLFIVNLSNDSSTELTISTPTQIEEPLLCFENSTFHFPIMYSFGTVHFIFEVIDTGNIR